MQGRLSLRERLVLLVLAAILPLAGLSAWLVAREIESTAERARTQLKFTASAVAASQDRIAESVHHLLGAIASMPEVREGRPDACNSRLELLRQRFPVYANLGVADGSGRVVCIARGQGIGLDVSDRAFFQRAMAQRGFVIGEADHGRVTGSFALSFALPILERERVVGVVYAALDLTRTADVLSSLDLPPESRVVITDRTGRVLMLYPATPLRKPGERITSPELLDLAVGLRAGAGDIAGIDGRERVYAAVPSRPIASEGLLAIVSQDRDRLLAAPNERMREAAIVIALTLLAVLVAAWWIAGNVFLKPVKQILGAVRRIEHGFLHARVPFNDRNARGEFARLAGAFNLMAESLEMRQHDVEAELGRSREAYEVLDTVLNSMHEGLVAVDATGRVLLYNTAATRLFELEATEQVPLAQWPAHFGLHDPETGQLLDAQDMSIARGLRGEVGETLLLVRNRRAAGERILHCGYGPMRGESGITGALAAFSDVTDLKKAEADLIAFSGMLQRTAEAAQAMGRHRTVEQIVPEVEAQARRVLGVARAHLRLGEEGEPAPSAPGERAVPLIDGHGRGLGFLVLGKEPPESFSEREAFVAIELAQLAANAIQTARLFEQIQELNAHLESRIAERTAELSQQSRLYRTLAEQAPEVVWNTDASGTYLSFLNRAWYDLVGGTEADWIGKSGLTAIHPDDREEVRANWERSRRTLGTFTGVRRLRAKDGTYHTMSYKGAPVLDEDGKVVFWVGVDTNITGQKAIESALRAANQELEAFSYSVSHDLRAPLAAIDGFSKALASRAAASGLDEKSAHYLARIQAGVNRMEQLIDALLGLSRVAREAMRPQPVDLSALAREIVEQLQVADGERQVSIRVEDGMTVQADPALLRVLMQNLIGNAWKFTAKSSRPSIEVGWSAAHGAWYVRDNGVGFDMGYAGKLFTAFQRLHSESEFPGTGIGLATVRRIVARHGGRAWAESSAGAGTTIYFTLAPAAAAAD